MAEKFRHLTLTLDANLRDDVPLALRTLAQTLQFQGNLLLVTLTIVLCLLILPLILAALVMALSPFHNLDNTIILKKALKTSLRVFMLMFSVLALSASLQLTMVEQDSPIIAIVVTIIIVSFIIAVAYMMWSQPLPNHDSIAMPIYSRCKPEFRYFVVLDLVLKLTDAIFIGVLYHKPVLQLVF